MSDIPQSVLRKQRDDLLAQALAQLSSRDIDIIAKRFGFFGHPQIRKDIAAHHRVSTPRIQQIEARALRRLSKFEELREYISV